MTTNPTPDLDRPTEGTSALLESINVDVVAALVIIYNLAIEDAAQTVAEYRNPRKPRIQRDDLVAAIRNLKKETTQ